MVGFSQLAILFFAVVVALIASNCEARPYDDEFGPSFYRPQYDAMRGFMGSRYLEKRVPNAADMMIRFGKRSGF
ncbi:hypothetical protein L596_024451 [Steinernema carpocapsae]|uniref:Uncharacterized protein n=1 Tax=Steinernema carpocapsae TaxID=34508 RepID=A0A4U5MGQ9_STECR|nr:hypothetical protein L596_024451 [Steinernema carpocapsae]